jgi:hypothetical protein
MLILMYRVRSHYNRVRTEIQADSPLDVANLESPLVVIPMPYWGLVSKKALRHALEISREVKVLHVAEEDKPDEFCLHWKQYVEDPAQAAGLPIPELIQLHSPYRFVITPIVDYVCQVADDNPGRRVVAIVPELVERRWYAYFLHTQRATLLKAALLMKGNDQISVLNVPWYIK